MPASRKPWPMKWIVLAIVLFLVPYTFLTLHYRKPGKAFEPYHDIRDRVNTERLLSAGYRRVALEADLPTEPLPHPTSAPIAVARGGLPSALKTTLVETPGLPLDITRAQAPAVAAAQQPYAFRFACTLPDEKRRLAGAELYLRGDELVITPDYEKLSGALLARSRGDVIQLTVPAGVLKPGRYRATIVGVKSSRAWTFEVR